MSRRAGVIFSYGLLVAQVFSSLLFTPYLIRSLGQSEYGLYALVTSITAYFMLLDGGVGNALVRYVVKYRVRGEMIQQRRFLGLSLAFYSGIAVAIVLLGLLLQRNLAGVFGHGLTPLELSRARVMLGITLWNAALTLVFSAFDRTLLAYERFALSKCLSISSIALRVVILTVLLHQGYRSIAVVAVNLVLTALFGLIGAWYVIFRLNVRPLFSGMEFAFIREVIGYSSFIFLQMIATQITAMSDQVLLGMMTNSVLIGIYAVGLQLSTYFQSIAGSINSVLMPGVVRLVERGSRPDDLLSEMVKVGRLVFMVLGLILVGFLVAGHDFTRLWAGADNGDAYWVALIQMSGLILVMTQSVGTQILWAMGRHKIQAVLNCAVALANIALVVLLIRWRPLIGASLGTAVAMVLGDVVVMNLVFKRAIGLRMKDYYRRLFHGILSSLCLAAAAGGLVRVLPLTGWWRFGAQCAVVVAVYAAAMALFGLNTYEKSLVKSVLRKRRQEFTPQREVVGARESA